MKPFASEHREAAVAARSRGMQSATGTAHRRLVWLMGGTVCRRAYRLTSHWRACDAHLSELTRVGALAALATAEALAAGMRADLVAAVGERP